MKDRRFPLIPVVVIALILVTVIAAMVMDVPANSSTTEVDVTLPTATKDPA